jgi:hypothetical protein
MTVLDDTSQGWPLPHPDNPARLDIERIRETLTAIATQLEDMATDAEVTAAVNAAVAALLGGAPAALDTLNELAAALGDDENFAATVTAALAAKANSADLKPVATGGSYNDLDDKPTLGSASEQNAGTEVGDVVTLVDVDGSPGLPAVVGKNLTGVVAEPTWSDIVVTTVSGSPTEVVFDDLDCEELRLTIKGIQCATADVFNLSFSTDNGATWTQFGNAMHTGGAGTFARYGYLDFSGLKLGNMIMRTAPWSTSPPPLFGSNINEGGVSTGAQINAIRIYTNGGAAFASTGTIEEQQR